MRCPLNLGNVLTEVRQVLTGVRQVLTGVRQVLTNCIEFMEEIINKILLNEMQNGIKPKIVSHIYVFQKGSHPGLPLHK